MKEIEAVVAKEEEIKERAMRERQGEVEDEGSTNRGPGDAKVHR